MHKEIPPEENLLKHIRQKDQAAPKETTVDIATNLIFKQEGASLPKEGTDWLNLLNRILLVVFLSVGIIGAYDLFANNQKREMPSEDERPITRLDDILPTKVVKPLAFDAYASVIKNKDIFHSILQPKKKRVGLNQAAQGPEASFRHLKLVGIVLDKNPEAIIEDEKARQTYFLKEGDIFQDVVIEKIQEGKVLLRTAEGVMELVQ